MKDYNDQRGPSVPSYFFYSSFSDIELSIVLEQRLCGQRGKGKRRQKLFAWYGSPWNDGFHTCGRLTEPH